MEKSESKLLVDFEPKIEHKFVHDTREYNTRYTGLHKNKTIEVLKKHWSAIRSFAMYRKYSKVYNLRVIDNNIHATLNGINMKNIFYDQRFKFKVQASLGYILYDNTNKKMRYWHASSGNDKLLDEPILIEGENDYNNFVSKLGNKDFLQHATKSRPNTTFSLHLLTNVTIYVYPIQNHSIGCPTTLPPSIKSNRAIVCADLDSNGKPFTNNMCIFRAIALSRNQNSTLERSTKSYFNQFLSHEGIPKSSYKGISLLQIPKIERLFNLSITVYSLQELGDGEMCACLISRPSTKYKEKLYLHLQDNHFSWIKNLQGYTKSFKCIYCSKLFRSNRNMNIHSSSCTNSTKLIYPSGAFSPPKSLFEKLSDIGIEVDDDRKHYPYIAVFDCETYLDIDNLPNPTATIEWKARHRLASVSVCTNVPNYQTPVTYLNDKNDEYDVAKRMMEYLELVSDKCYENLKLTYNDIFGKLKLIRDEKLKREERTMNKEGIENLIKMFVRLEKELDSYLRDLLCFGFQSKTFDIPVMKEHIVRYLIENNSKINMAIKKGNKYMALQTNKLRFLDIANYLPQGFSLAEYLKAMDVETSKYFWIYDKFTSMKMLDQTTFPKHEDFYSELKQKNITIEEYKYAKAVWNKRGMKNLRDMLIYYNEQDVQPLITAIERQNEFFKSRNLDFKSAISIPGLSIRYLFQMKTQQTPIFMFGYKFKDLHSLIRKNIRGGLSLVFNRYQEAGKTKIKEQYFGNNAKTTQVCEGWDCSSMYLHNLALCNMPTGAFIRRRKENNFCAEKSYSNGIKATEWIMWMEKILNTNIQHMFNGNEKRIGGRNIPVDGYAKLSNGKEIVLNYSGCWFHSHMCKLTPKGIKQDKIKDLENQLNTYTNLKYFQDLGFKVYHVWECQFDKMKSNSKQISSFCQQLDIEVDKRYKISEKQILEEVKSGKMFGMIEVDIHTPDKYKQAFSEFQPITKHSELTREDIGSHMKEFAIKNELLKRPTKTLLNSYYANKILLATPLLQWYLNHGLVCTQVYQVIQYKPAKCFQEFAKRVVTARIQGDQDSSKKIISDNCKLIGKYIKLLNHDIVMLY